MKNHQVKIINSKGLCITTLVIRAYSVHEGHDIISIQSELYSNPSYMTLSHGDSVEVTVLKD